MVKKIVKTIWILFFLVILTTVGIFLCIAKGWIGYMPAIEELENPNYKFATEIVTEDEQLLGTWAISKENRVYIGYDELPQTLINALIATEDTRFDQHSGVDVRALFRAIIKTGLLRQQGGGRKYHIPTNLKDALLPKCGKQDGTYSPKAYRMGDSGKLGTILYQRRDTHDVSQQV